MQEPDLPAAPLGVLKSRMGTFYPGSHVIFRGQDLHEDLKDLDWLALYLFGITGRRFDAAQLKLLNAIWTYTSYADARLWNNRVAALAGSSRSSGALGLAAALAVSEAAIYGGGILMRAIEFFIRALHETACGADLSDCVRRELELHRSIAGYGRPLVNGDERIQPLLKLAAELGLDRGPHLELALAVEIKLLHGRWRMKMNYAALVAALGADLGLDAAEFYLYMFPVFLAGMPPGYIEAGERPEGGLYAIPCDHIVYSGPARRNWPTANAEPGAST
ncbi:citryl-CoA lyase [Methylomonas sp. SURF-2]|uniref:Citryl-CoA lyase n=1 Tax=Methylomonas subterranea TaxID=2952225 RepID=A0ABT1TGT0_9GAMM|nr:citryl-CoA lyase [Methylomonas sp. SURF-2]MCQ8104662.1 citryl-CoA lyase [Methylomonas sp. SURF-2]